MHKNIPQIVQLITSEIRTPEEKKAKWASFKRQHADRLRELLELQHTDFENPGTLLGFDIDPVRELILLNYTGQAHNELHDVEGGWSEPLRQMRGLIYSFGGRVPRLVSRGFEKFFNHGELPENTHDALRAKYGDQKFTAREKADGHMIEYFMHNGELCATTRGKFGTASSVEALGMFTASDFELCSDILNKPSNPLMTVVVELVTPSTEVHVDYSGKETLYLLGAYRADGSKVPLAELNVLSVMMSDRFTMPDACEFTLDEMVEEINRREVQNHEGWVMDFNGELIKFKYISYIGRMVQSKLSYKYVMNCIVNDRLHKMLHTLPEEVRDHGYKMAMEVQDLRQRAKRAGDHKVLYRLHNKAEGSKAYFQTVCRNFYRSAA